jgi:hypothetical protein
MKLRLLRRYFRVIAAIVMLACVYKPSMAAMVIIENQSLVSAFAHETTTTVIYPSSMTTETVDDGGSTTFATETSVPGTFSATNNGNLMYASADAGAGNSITTNGAGVIVIASNVGTDAWASSTSFLFAGGETYIQGTADATARVRLIFTLDNDYSAELEARGFERYSGDQGFGKLTYLPTSTQVLYGQGDGSGGIGGGGSIYANLVAGLYMWEAISTTAVDGNTFGSLGAPGNGQFTLTLTPLATVPLPPTVWMMLAGLIGLGFRVRPHSRR